MPLDDSQLSELVGLTQALYDQLQVADVAEDVSYRGYLDIDTPFGLDEEAYYGAYFDLARFVFSLPDIAERWSEDGINHEMHGLVRDLAKEKLKKPKSPKVDRFAKKFAKRIAVDFDELETLVPVIGLSVNQPFQLADVWFYPLVAKKSELEGRVLSSFFDDLYDHRDCMAGSPIAAEAKRSTEVLRSRVEYALNVLRFIGSLVWNREPMRHIYLAGQERARVSYALAINSKGLVSEIGDSEFTPVPYKIDEEFDQYAKFYGFDYLMSISATSSPTPLEQSLLTAIQWFGDGTHEFVDLSKFLKFYVAIETATKRDRERAKSVLPKRISVLMQPWDKTRQRSIQADLEDLIDERNAVFHGGQPIKFGEDYLARTSMIVARGALNRLRQDMVSHGWQTKDDLDQWVNQQYDSYLQ